MSIDLYEAPHSPYCRSVSLIARIINVPINSIFVNLRPEVSEQLKPEYLEKNPFHLVPTINDDGFYLSESRAIAAYLVDKYAPDHTLYPKDIQKRAIINQILYYEGVTVGPIMSSLVRPYFFDNIIPTEETRQKAKHLLKPLDGILEKRQYIAGDNLTIADITLRATLTLAEIAELDLSDLKNITKWSARIREETNPAYGEVNDEFVEDLKQMTANKKAELISSSVIDQN